jgi:hypothetical protein
MDIRSHYKQLIGVIPIGVLRREESGFVNCTRSKRASVLTQIPRSVPLSLKAVSRDDTLAITASLRDFDNGERGCSAAESVELLRAKFK